MAKVFRPKKEATIITVLACAILVTLGVWQVQRLGWKTQLLQTIEERMAQKPAPLPETLENPAEWKYRRVTLTGTFLHDHEFLITPRVLDGKAGYHLVTPLRRAAGGIVFVNRGWISADLMESALRPPGLMQVEGIVQLPEKYRFTPDNDAVGGTWYWMDTQAMARAAGLEGAAPVVVTVAARTPGAWPAGGQVRLDIPNDHRQYAMFWFCMAGVLLAIYVLSGLKEEKKGKGP